MKISCVFALCLAFFGFAFCCLPAHAQDVAATYRSDYNGNRYDFTVTHAQIQNTPDWKEDAENPPLSARKALSAARVDLATFLPNASQWTSRSISLVGVGASHKWMYVIEFFPPSRAPEDLSSPLRVLVLMDGTAIRPTIKPSSS